MHALLLLAAGIQQQENGTWHSTPLSLEGAKDAAPGGIMRVEAAVYLFQSGAYDCIIVPGGQGSDKNLYEVPHPTLFHVLSRELHTRGIEKKYILGEEISNTTYEQIVETKKIVRAKNIDTLTIISSRYHLPRVKALVDHEKELGALLGEGHIHYKEAEAVCAAVDPAVWKEQIETAYQSDWMFTIIEREKNGVEQIIQGTYQF
ncbi:MAG: hypothetical protein COU33_02490 [Candidatus Magasanikbacteria bacterium CG10_big_fil_rev_8_21_14_0_10_43_6]|uniref:DUF218 domain-containing protein n=1 Tax=Candidatus Magasanikbacteria bacterium CG10_big_fil_rev_8_21_14_0_10_43_6 TaxID=1974650 RepID=A0A2M6W161_9BACT|nr:MAG: hypothetical protein COU33_02490 [Candidatus Magasanikbacteria bacterium CG10_big_fil_rev_8_21_14_0_10_43_6]